MMYFRLFQWMVDIITICLRLDPSSCYYHLLMEQNKRVKFAIETMKCVYLGKV